MKEIDLLFLIAGAIAGVIVRYKITSSFPLLFDTVGSNVFVVNILGSFILGVFSVMSEFWNLDSRYSFLVAIGFCGSLTTMSSFALESVEMLENRQIFQTMLNVMINVVFSFLAIYGGRIITTFFLEVK